VPGPPQNRTCPFPSIRLKQALGASDDVGSYDPIPLRGGGSSAGPRTSTRGSGVSFVRWFRPSFIVVSWGSPDRVCALSSPTTVGRYPAGYPRRPTGGLARLSWFPAAFRPPAFASRSSCARPAIGVPYGRPTEPRTGARSGTGLPCSAHTRRDRDGCPLYPRDDGAHPEPERLPGRRLPPSQTARPCLSPPATHHTRVRFTRHQQGFTQFTRPVFPSPVAARMETSRPWALPRASHPAITRNARRGGDRPTEHVPGTTAQLTSVDLQSSSSLNVCDLTSHVAKRASCRYRAGCSAW
jgi:hypothetical protein